MDKEDKLLAKCLIFAGGFIFTILSLITLIQTSKDFNKAKVLEPALLKGANLSPLLLVFIIVTCVAIALLVASFFFTFIKNEKSKVWQNRLVLSSIIILVLTVALYTIMECSSYIDFSTISNTIKNDTSEGIIRKFYTSHLATSMLYVSIGLVINLLLLNYQNKFDTIAESVAVTEANQTVTNEEHASLEQEINKLKDQLRTKTLKEELAQLQSQLGIQAEESKSTVDTVPVESNNSPSDTESNQITNNNVSAIDDAKEELEQPISNTDANVIEEEAEIKAFEDSINPENNI